jgi:hypothetical protein
MNHIHKLWMAGAAFSVTATNGQTDRAGIRKEHPSNILKQGWRVIWTNSETAPK